jgi:surfeit locus 1 family protein
LGKLDATGPTEGFRLYPEWRTTLFVALLVPLMTGLGFWQLQRAEEKTALAASFEQKQVAPPAPLVSVWDVSASALAYLPVTFSGRFLAEEYFLLDNRIFKGRFGYEVLGVFELEGTDQLVLVNRGWLAADPARLVQPEVPPVVGTVTVSGQVYVAPGAPYLLAEQELSPGWPKLVQALEMDILVPPLQAISGRRVFSYPVRINADAPGALGVDWQVVNISPAKHRGYAVQWFCMAAVLLIFYVLRSCNIWQLLRPSRRTRI